MTSNAFDAMAKPIDVNLIFQLWHIFSTSKIFFCFFPKYFELVEFAMVWVIGSVEDEQYFNSLAFYKFELYNWLANNLGLLVRMYSQKFYNLQSFSYIVNSFNLITYGM
jgi:hypothetical protein